MAKNDDTFNDRMVKKTVIPAIYLWLLASGAVVAMGIWKPDVVLQNLDGFIALIAIIGGVAAPALNTVLRMWESEQAQEVDAIPVGLEHRRVLLTTNEDHTMAMEKLAQKHEQEMAKSAQVHQQEVDKIKLENSGKTAELKPIEKRK